MRKRPVIARMDIPPPGGATFLLAFLALVIFLVGGASLSLINYEFYPLYVSILSFLVLLAFAVSLPLTIYDQGGLRRFVWNGLAMFSFHHFVEVRERDDGLTVRFGFTLLMCRFNLFQIPSTAIVSVEWTPGQATSMTGRDMNDWSVYFWFYPKRFRRWSMVEVLEKELHIVGSERAKPEIVAFGHSFIAFLRSAGIELHPTTNECEFTTDKSESTNTESSAT